jgi:protoporphyrinogen oxidase
MFGYVPGGYHRILARLAEHLHAQGVTIRTGFPAAEVRRTPDGRLSITSRTRERLTFDQVVVTAPSAPAADLCPDLAPLEKDQLRGIEYQGIVCASLLLRKPLSPYYVTNITDPCPFTAVIEMTALVDPLTFGGRTLVYLPKYVPVNDPALEFTDEHVKREFLPALQKMHPHLTDDDVLTFQVSRVRSVFAIPTLNYSKKLPSMTTSVAGLHIVNSSHIVNGTLNVNETVQLAERTVPELIFQSTAAGKAAYARI